MSRQLKKRHLRLTHEILQAIARREFDGSETSILAAIILGTYGVWNPTTKEVLTQAPFSQQRLMDETGLSRRCIQRSLLALTQAQVIRVYRQPFSHKPGVYGVESHPEKWLRQPRFSASRTTPNPASRMTPKSEPRMTPNSASRMTPKRVTHDAQNDSQSRMVEPKNSPVDHVDLPSVVVDRHDDHRFEDYDRVLKSVSPIRFNRTPRESLVLAEYAGLPDWTLEQKLEALRQGVAQTLVYMQAKPGIHGPAVCWAVEKATKLLAALNATDQQSVRYYEPDPNEEGWWEKRERLARERKRKEGNP